MTLFDIAQFVITGEFPSQIERFLCAAKKGNANAQFKLGIFRYTGCGLPQDTSKAVRWFHMAAKRGHIEAQVYLGRSHFSERGVYKNIESAYAWFDQSAMNGCEKAKNWQATISQQMTPEELAEGRQLSLELAERINGIHCRTQKHPRSLRFISIISWRCHVKS